MKTVNSVSGGKTSAYIAANYPADYNVFALVRTSDPGCRFPDRKLAQEVEDRLQMPFVGTLEEDAIIHTIFDLEQYIGQRIDWVSGMTFDELIKSRKYIPNKVARFCTTELKVVPIFHWWYNNIKEVVEMRIGFRANETRRAKKKSGEVENIKYTVSKHEDGRNKWEYIDWRTFSYPLIEDNIYKDDVEKYWQENQNVRFANHNNCVGCYWRSEVFLRKQADWHPNKFDWFAKQERIILGGSWKTGITYDDIKKHKLQLELSFDDFNDCDSGYCGI